jgi:hypothetical protein
MKKFVAVGDYIINPDLLAYAVVEEERQSVLLRLGFAAQAGPGRAELRLGGDDARAALRWLRLNSMFLTQDASLGPLGQPSESREPAASRNGVGSRERDLYAVTGPAR